MRAIPLMIIVMVSLSLVFSCASMKINIKTPVGVLVEAKTTTENSSVSYERIPYDGLSVRREKKITIIVPYTFYSREGFFEEDELKKVSSIYGENDVIIDCKIETDPDIAEKYKEEIVPIRFLLRKEGEVSGSIDEGTIEHTMLTGEVSYNYTRKDGMTIVTSTLSNPRIYKK